MFTLALSSVFRLCPHWSVSLLLMGAVTFAACAPRLQPQPPPPSPTPSPLALQLREALEQRRQAVTSLRGLARVVYSDPYEQGTAKQAVAVAAPDQFRLELFSPIGIALLSTCDGHSLAAYFPQEKTIYRGAATPFNIARFVRIELSPREIAGLLLGLPVLPPDSDLNPVQVDPDTLWYRLDLSAPNGDTHVLLFEQRTSLLMRWEVLASDGTRLARVHLDDYRRVGGQDFPFEIVLADAQGQQEASIYYERVELNPRLADTLFTLGSIPGVQEIDIDAIAKKHP